MSTSIPQPVRRAKMRIEWDVAITTDYGTVLRADGFPRRRTKRSGDYMIEHHPEIAEEASNCYQNWEVVDPEKWVPDSYVCVRVDSRGTGRSQG